MHDLDRTLESEYAFETADTELDPEIFQEAEVYDEYAQGGPLSEEEEMALAEELLSLSGEAELDQFLGKLFKKFGGGKIFSSLGKVLKPIAKKVLPIAGRVAGTFFGGPAGGAIGGKLGSLATKLFEVDFEGMDPEVQDFEVAQRFVRLASTAAQNAAEVAPTANPEAAARSAVAAAAQVHAPGLLKKNGAGSAARPCACGCHRRPTGRWIRRGRKIVILGA